MGRHLGHLASEAKGAAAGSASHRATTPEPAQDTLLQAGRSRSAGLGTSGTYPGRARVCRLGKGGLDRHNSTRCERHQDKRAEK
ncbi:unnamed protein product [Lampetra planeri]